MYNEFIPQKWTDGILENLDNATVFKPLCSTAYEGLIQGSGSSVKMLEVGDATTKKYTGTVNYEKLKDASKVMKIDQKYYTALDIDDINKTQSNVDLLSKSTNRMGVSMAQNLDTSIAGLYGDAGITFGTTASPTSLTSSNIVEFFTNVATKMDENNVASTGRVAVIPPWLYQKLVLAGIFQDTDNSAILSNGQVGERLGFTLYKSNNISHSDSDWYAPMFFIKDMTIGFAGQIDKTEAGRHEGAFSDYIRALNVYGRKVIYPQTLCTSYVVPGSEV